jgi:hypothetical protein
METIPTKTVLDMGAKCLGNHPDDLVRRITLAKLLVESKAVRNIDAGIIAFRLWAVPESRNHPTETILSLANDKVRPHANPLHE